MDDLEKRFNYLYNQEPNKKYTILNIHFKPILLENYDPIIIYPRIGNILYKRD
jgi:hypothetical protein